MPTDDPRTRALRAVAHADQAVKHAEAERVRAVKAARTLGLSWIEVGDALGISRQAANKHYTPKITEVEGS